MRATFYLPLLGAILTLAACKEQTPPAPKIDGIECDAKCQARRDTSGAGDFPALDTKVIPRGRAGEPKPQTKE